MDDPRPTVYSADSPNPIAKGLYEDLVHYFKYASCAYNAVCPRPNGQKLVLQFSNPVSDIQGFVARDDRRRELVVALRGSASITDILLDAQIVMVPLMSPGIDSLSGVRVHSGFLVEWDAISLQVMAIVKQQMVSHPDYAIVTTGHSLGGSVALLGAVVLQNIYKSSVVRTYSYGAPRTGNEAFARYVNETFGMLAYRVVHGNDGVPTMIHTSLGYHHHGVEYWQHTNPPSCDTTLQCDAEGEDQACSASIPSQGVNLAHTMYFGIVVSTPFCWSRRQGLTDGEKD